MDTVGYKSGLRAALATVLIVFISVGVSAQKKKGAKPTDPVNPTPWYEMNKDKRKGFGALSWLHEGNGCSQDAYPIGNGDDLSSMPSGWNDEARSIELYGPQGTAVTVFDGRVYDESDDYSIIIKTDDDPVCISSFERVTPNEWIQFRGYNIWWDKLNGIDGKVSSLRWGRWW
jgi:hypothetical protein